MADWTPLNENHAIEVMAVYIRFHEEVPDLSLRRALEEIGDVARDLGLTQTRPSQAIQLKVSTRGLAHEEQRNVLGQTFARAPLLGEGRDDVFQDIENIQVEKDAIVYRSFEYISWDYHFERIKKIFEPVFSHLLNVVTFSRVGMEYLDKFYTELSDPAPVNQLLRQDSAFISPHVFSDESLFHVHTGRFLDVIDGERTRQNVKINATDDDDNDRRWIDITTTLEKIYASDRLENPEVLSLWEIQHRQLKEFLSDVIVDEQTKRIFLNG